MARDDPQSLLSFAPTIEIGGMDYPLIAQNLERFRVVEARGGLSSLELVLIDSVGTADGDATFASGAGSPLDLGAGVRLFAGPAERGAGEIFDGQITGLEAEVRESAPPIMTILAEDRLFPLRRKRRTKLFEQQSLSDVIGAVVSDYGLTPEVRDGVDTIARDWLQADETDLAFLRRILARFDCDLQIVAAKLQVGRNGKDQRALVTLSAGTTLSYARITADIAEQVSEIRIASFDPASGEAVNETAQCAGYGPGHGTSGPDTLSQKFKSVSLHLGRFGPMTSGDAQAIAATECERRARAFVRAAGTAQGNSDLRVGSWIELAGVNPRFANQYAVSKAVHRWDRTDGYRTDFEAECAYLGDPA
ncbi:MAG: hypothetical protein JWN66_3156 [Sphingomonas bacterium]|uniref:phage late control D family protein n=1 Tax=Sphingomonas bacterium TaxID=1895847 RepID=UPI0026133D5C|nr:contractile injection system protein, VgrG/Pvc8 family [Sphingomonas bacterium]MDB5706040.1 hypothetical protein [Sphingomonas bacterium]